MTEINYNLKVINYGVPPLIQILNVDNGVGDNGENLTIAILSCNRAKSTIKLLDSIDKFIPYFQGTILIADNNSTPNEKSKLKTYLKSYRLSIKLIEFPENFGVSGGRNKIIQYVNTEWVMNLDNDIYFVEDPIQNINNSIQSLGCKFLNLPLLDENENNLFANGGALFIDLLKEKIHLGGGSMHSQQPSFPGKKFPDSYGSFLFGGASVISVKEFINCGMFDENMFIGFEDFDFSITLFQKGFKIGNNGFVSLVHDHKKPDNVDDIEYEKIRFSNEKLLESAIYFEKKHGVVVWNQSTQDWLELKQKKLGIHEDNNISNDLLINKNKKKIALITDTDDWCFYNIASQIKQNLSDEFEIKIIPFEYLELNIIKLFLLIKDYDLAHFFWRGHLNFIYDDFADSYSRSIGISSKNIIQEIIPNTILTTSVYDHNYLNLKDDYEVSLTKNALGSVKNYTVSSNKLKQIYNELTFVNDPYQIITDGVDLDKFKMRDKNKFSDIENRTIKIGWVGNSKFHNNETSDLKGIQTIIKPVIQELKSEGYNIEEYFADKQIRMIPFEKMPNYYNEIDLYICASLHEGTPNPVMEAMATGIPILSTDVGLIPELFGVKQKEFIFKRTKQDLKAKLKKILDNKYFFEELSEENLNQIKSWDWKIKCEDFRSFFKGNLKERSVNNEK